MDQIAYLLLFRRQGSMLYSRCFGDFCQQVTQNEGFLNEFLMMVTKFSQMFVDEVVEVKNVSFGGKIFFFYCLENCDVIAVIGLTQDCSGGKEEEIAVSSRLAMLSDLVRALNTLINESFPEFRTMEEISEEKIIQFEKKLFQFVLDAWYHRHGDEDSCPFKDRCLMSVHSPMWKELQKIFEGGRS